MRRTARGTSVEAASHSPESWDGMFIGGFPAEVPLPILVA